MAEKVQRRLDTLHQAHETQSRKLARLEAELQAATTAAPAAPAEADRLLLGTAPVGEPPPEQPAARPPALPTEPRTPAGAAPAGERVVARQAAAATTPSPRPAVTPAPTVGDERGVVKPPFSLEHFMGVKLFAWLGGVALFFGVIFFVRYAFERDLVPPAMRVALGFITGGGLLAGGLWTHRKPPYRVLAQALCATAVLILYGVTFAAHAVYQFAAFGPLPTFLLMSVITVAAILVALRLNALVVAVLGMLGGFITPFLLPLVQDNPLALFGYIAILDIGLLATSVRRRWSLLAMGAALGTVVTQATWFANFFVAGRYDQGAASWLAIGILCFFCGLFLAGAWWGARREREAIHQPAAAFTMVGAAMAGAFIFLNFPDIANRPVMLYTFVFVVNLVALAVTVVQPRFAPGQLLMAAATLIHLAVWTVGFLSPDLLGRALAAYLVLGGLHAVWPVLCERLRPGLTSAFQRQCGPGWPPLILLLMLLPILMLRDLSVSLWLAVLLTNALVIALAALNRAALPVTASLVVTMLLAGVWLHRLPDEAGSLGPFLVVVTLFAAVFAAAGVWLAQRIPTADPGENGPALALDSPQIVAVTAGALPFVLLILALGQLPVPDPSPVFGVGLLLAALLVTLALRAGQPMLIAAAAVFLTGVELMWHVDHFEAARPGVPLAWYLGIHGFFVALPMVFRRGCRALVAPWAATAVSGAGHFVLVHEVMRHSFPNPVMGLVPAAFALPALGALWFVLRDGRQSDEVKRAQLAWLGGAALLFITLIFPIQFERQWLTIGWALQGAALVWLFRRVPHQGLLWTGLALLAVAFLRLAVNPAVFDAYPRSGTRIFNWHLYTYGVVAAAQFAAAAWLARANLRIGTLDARAGLYSLGGILLFLLLNIQIADFFTPPGDRFVAFQFAGNFARDMTYTIAWGLFALGLLVIGIALRARGARLASIGLLAATLIKLFLHDLARIDSIYRIGALIGVAVIAFIASFLFQRFFAQSSQP